MAASLPSRTASTTRLAHAIAATPGIARVSPAQVSPDGRAALMIAYPTTGEQDAATNALVNQIRTTVIPRATAGTGVRAYLTGPNAGNVSFANIVGQRLPWLIGVVVVLSTLLLLVMFRSVTVAVKAALMNLLSISAAYGVLTVITQWGWLGYLFGFPEKMPVTTWVPIFLFVILFGLSMDYEVFLLSRSGSPTTRQATTRPPSPPRWPGRPGDHGGGSHHGRGLPVLRPRRGRLREAIHLSLTVAVLIHAPSSHNPLTRVINYSTPQLVTTPPLTLILQLPAEDVLAAAGHEYRRAPTPPARRRPTCLAHPPSTAVLSARRPGPGSSAGSAAPASGTAGLPSSPGSSGSRA